MGKNKELLLVHSSMERVNLVESVDIMLTPQFYTLKRESLPLKYAYQAKKIAPSLFEGLLEEGGNYEYAVLKEEDGWTFIAYDSEKITQFLESKGITVDKIAKIYFAQEALKSFTKPLILDEIQALVALENSTVVVVPRIALPEAEQEPLSFDESFLPAKGGVSLKGGTSSVFTQQQALSLAAIFLLFAGIFVVEGLRYSGNSQEDTEVLQSLYEAHPALESSYTRQGIIEKYRSIDKKERKKREVIKAFSSMIFKGVTLTSLNINDKKFKAEFSCTSVDVAKRVKRLAKKAGHNVSTIKQSNNLKLEGNL